MKPINKIIIYSTIALITGFAAYRLTIQYLPNYIFSKLHQRVENRGISDNELVYVNLPSDTSRSVVMPNPDFLYISCFYDVSNRPLRFLGTLPDSSYWSISFYKPNTVNWYIKNDTEYTSNKLDLVLAEKERDYKVNFGTSEVAESPTDKGFMLIRILVTDHSEESLKRYKAWQESVKIEILD